MKKTEKTLRREVVVEKIKEIVNEDFGKFELNIKTIGEEKLFLTPDYVGRIFKSVTGESLKDYINRIRVEKAKELDVKPVTLGRRILRTETAGLTTLSILMYLLEES